MNCSDMILHILATVGCNGSVVSQAPITNYQSHVSFGDLVPMGRKDRHLNSTLTLYMAEEASGG